MNAEETDNEFIRRVVTRDFEGAGDLVSDDLEYDNVPIGKNIGRDVLKGFLAAMMNGIDEVEFVTHRQTHSGDTVMNERTDRFCIRGHWIELPVAGVFVVNDDGLISLWRDYFDLATFQNAMASIAPPDA